VVNEEYRIATYQSVANFIGNCAQLECHALVMKFIDAEVFTKLGMMFPQED